MLSATTEFSLIQKLIIITRFYSLTTSTFSVALGTVLAVFIGQAEFHVLNFLLAFIGMVLLHISANILSDIHDFQRGIDTEPLPGCGAIVYHLITFKQAVIWILVTFLVGATIGLYLALSTTIGILWVGLLGVAIGFLYPATGDGLKYHALGDLCVFLNFGILGTLGAWMVQTGEFAWFPALCGVPPSLLVIAILHVNNWRDIERDAEVGATSVASVIGDKASYVYYYALIFGSYVLTALLVFGPRWVDVPFPALPFAVLPALCFSLPQAVKLSKLALMKRKKETYDRFLLLLEETAKFHMIFSLAFITGVIVGVS